MDANMAGKEAGDREEANTGHMRHCKGGGRIPGYRRVVVEAAMTVETSEFVWAKVGFSRFRRSTAIRLSAVLSSTTTASALRVSRLRVRRLLYGWTTTSLISF